MYIIGRKGEDPKKKRRRRRIIFIVLILLAAISWWVYKYAFKPHTTLKQAAPVITKIAFDETKTKHFDETNFGIDLPVDWIEQRHDTSPYNVYTFQGGTKDTNQRLIDVYEDKIPTGLSLNRALAVESNGPKISLRGEVSDNCANYTKDPRTTNNDSVKAKWQNFDFLCNEAATARNATGTVSAEGSNQLTLAGASGQHRYFLVYSENSYTPDYKVFYSAITSLQVK
jgi:hypothetical protein